MKKPIKVLAFGSFDLVHKGHEFFLKSAKELGDKLIVIVARDSTIKEFKKKPPLYSEKQRLEHVKQLPFVDKAILGYEGKDKHKVIEDIKPDIIAFGYDQESFNKNIEKDLKKRNLKAKIVLIGSHKPHIYKSNLLKKKLKNN